MRTWASASLSCSAMDIPPVGPVGRVGPPSPASSVAAPGAHPTYTGDVRAASPWRSHSAATESLSPGEHARGGDVLDQPVAADAPPLGRAHVLGRDDGVGDVFERDGVVDQEMAGGSRRVALDVDHVGT